MRLARLETRDLRRLVEIDRSEHVTAAYTRDGAVLRVEPADWDVPNWSPTGSGDHSVAGQIAEWTPVVDRGAALIGAFEDDLLLGVAIVEPDFEEAMAWMAFLHVSRAHRRHGVGSALWRECTDRAGRAGATSVYVSATPSASAVGFYLSRGCGPAPEPHPALFAKEPEDIHLIRYL